MRRIASRHDEYHNQALALKLITREAFNDYSDATCLHAWSDTAWDTGNTYKQAGFQQHKRGQPRLLFIAQGQPHDQYSWSIDSPWGAKSGVIAKDREKKGLTPYTQETFNTRDYIENELSHRHGEGEGYDAVYLPASYKWTLYR